MQSMADFEIDAYERAVLHALDNPLPQDLHRLIAEYIEPVTTNRRLDHGECMSLIGIAYPLINEYLIQRARGQGPPS
jgi:hypothetical protein